MGTRLTTEADLDHAMAVHATVFNAIQADADGYAQTTVDSSILSLECQNAGAGEYHGGPSSGSAYEFQAMLITACAYGEGRATNGVFPRSRIEHMIDDLRKFEREPETSRADKLQQYLDDHPEHFA